MFSFLNSESLGRPPTLWWLLMAAASAHAALDAVGIDGALHEELDAPVFFASSSKTRTNSSPMILRFFSGSVTPASAARKRSEAST